VTAARAGIFAFLLSMALAAPTAAEPARILILIDDAQQEIARRLHAELGAAGFEVVAEPASMEETSRPALERAAREAGAVAALRVRQLPGSVEVWVTDRVTGKTVLREVVLPPEGANDVDRDALVAVRVVELLRASLLEIESSLPPRGEVATPPAAARALVAPVRKPAPPAPAPAPVPTIVAETPAPPRLRVGLGPAVGLSPGGFGPSGQAVLDLRYAPVPHLDVALAVVAPIVPVGVEADVGSATVVFTQFGAEVAFVLAPVDSEWNAALGVGTALSWMHVDGSADPPFEEHADDLLTAFPYARLLGSYGLSRIVRLVLDARIGGALPRPVVSIADRAEASWGRPAAIVGLDLEIGIDLGLP
jgi:hypothetical protein